MSLQTRLSALISAIGADIKNLYAVSSIPVLTYDNRGDLRSVSAIDGVKAVVEGLGLFVHHVGSDEPDDDESCFATATGRWLLECPHWDVVDRWQMPDSFDEWFKTRILRGFAACALSSVSAGSSASFTGSIRGAAVGDCVLVNPPAQLGSDAANTGRLSFHAFVSDVNKVTVVLTNASAATATTNTAIRVAWPVNVVAAAEHFPVLPDGLTIRAKRLSNAIRKALLNSAQLEALLSDGRGAEFADLLKLPGQAKLLFASASAIDVVMGAPTAAAAVMGTPTARLAMSSSAALVGVPTMTSNTSPSGIASASNQYSEAYAPYLAYDKLSGGSSRWIVESGLTTDQWIAYEFVSSIMLFSCTVSNYSTSRTKDVVVQAFVDGVWVDASARHTLADHYEAQEIPISVNVVAKKFRVFCFNAYDASRPGFQEVNFEGVEVSA